MGLGLAPRFWLYLVIMAILGISLPLWNAPFMVLLQTKVEAAFMGRVLSVFTMLSSTMMPLGMVVFGPVSDRISIAMLLIGTGMVINLLAIPLRASKTLREAGSSPVYNVSSTGTKRSRHPAWILRKTRLIALCHASTQPTSLRRAKRRSNPDE